MIDLVFAAPDLDALRRDIQHERFESAAILLARPVPIGETENFVLLIEEVHIASSEDYVERTAVNVKLDTSFCLALEKRAKLNGWSLIYSHSHVHAGKPQFSDVDDRCERDLKTYLAMRSIVAPHVTLLFSRDHLIARELGTGTAVRVKQVGGNLLIADARLTEPTGGDQFDRQIRAFGSEGQSRLQSMTVAVIGLGGTGSIITQQLAHLGVSRLVLVDHDCVESTNLNRLVGATKIDIDRQKTAVAAEMVQQIRPETVVDQLIADVTVAGTAKRLVGVDFIFNCTDTQASRHLVNQFAYQYRVPVIDMGVSITVSEGPMQLAGHVKMIAPGLPCLWCARHLDPNRIREELMTKAQRAADPYFQGGHGVVQPSVISLNSTVASLAVTMFLSAVTGIPSNPRYLTYDANRGRVHAAEVDANPDCAFCGRDSTAGMATDAPLPERRNE